MRHQVKSQWYYIFWLVMAVAVVGGQLYVGSGYRKMAEEQAKFTQAVYDQQVGWGPCQRAIEMHSQDKKNKNLEFE